MDTFERNWARCLGDDKLVDYMPRIAEHLAGLNDALTPSAEQFARYVKQFGVRSPTAWSQDAFKKVGVAKPTKKLTEANKKELKELAVVAIYDHIRNYVGRQNSPTFVLSQIERVEQPVRVWRARIASRNDSADILADLLIAGSAAMVRCHAKSSPKSGVAQVIHDRLVSGGYFGEAALEVFRRANAWKRQVTTDPLEQKDDTLARSWAYFKRWTGFAPEDWPWDACVPQFQVTSKKDAEDGSGESSDE